MEVALERGEPVLIFPGRHVQETELPARDRLLDGGIYPGAAHLARRYGLPILPAYLTGAQSWRAGQPASVIFGPAFGSAGMSKEEVCRQIIARLRACEQR